MSRETVSTRPRRAIRERLVGRPVAGFFAVTCTFSWSLQAVAGLGRFGPLWTVFLVVVSIFGPAVGAVAVVRCSGTSLTQWVDRTIRQRVDRRLFVGAILLPVAFVLVHTAFLRVAGIATTLTIGVDSWMTFLANAVVVALIGGGQEEFGWRGFALPHLQEQYSQLTATLTVGAMWTVWHLPVFYVLPSGVPTTGGSPLGFAAFTVALTGLFTVVYNAAGGSVAVTMLMHGCFNASGALYQSHQRATVAGVQASELLKVPAVLSIVVVLLFALRRWSPDRRRSVRWSRYRRAAPGSGTD
ncbi:CPBP family intramembrane glutamic endopeptidase [Halomicrobium salinisoli]|uniref:CPBP family intramembrane glutamic endopeptidase n=1 Tax=Halomicrobium salinisoli TaxID=2878391 RepID=UPI001CEFC4FF|nr:CPBP family intramembrane glutamic endopeptidase [Halomicrobium salinisoli]